MNLTLTRLQVITWKKDTFKPPNKGKKKVEMVKLLKFVNVRVVTNQLTKAGKYPIDQLHGGLHFVELSTPVDEVTVDILHDKIQKSSDFKNYEVNSRDGNKTPKFRLPDNGVGEWACQGN